MTSDRKNTRPEQPVQLSEVAFKTWYENTEREIHGKALSDFGGIARIGVGVLELPPGSNTRPAHYHTEEEEQLFVLEGSLTMHLGVQSHQLRPGVHFPAAQALSPYLANDSSDPARYIMIGERIETDQVIYP